MSQVVIDNPVINSPYREPTRHVTPGITIRDRLRVLLPNDPQNYYRQRDVIPAQWLEQLGQAKIVITNFHTFGLRERVAAGKLTKAILGDGEAGAFTETPDQMVRRIQARNFTVSSTPGPAICKECDLRLVCQSISPGTTVLEDTGSGGLRTTLRTASPSAPGSSL